MHAPVQPKWLRSLLVLLPLPAILRALWALGGGTMVLLAMRFLLVSQLKAEVVTRAVSDSALARTDSLTRQDVQHLGRTIDTIRANQNVNIKAVCLDHTKYQQDMIGVQCPANLYKGAN